MVYAESNSNRILIIAKPYASDEYMKAFCIPKVT